MRRVFVMGPRVTRIALGAGSTERNPLGLFVFGRKIMFQSLKVLLIASPKHKHISVNVFVGKYTCCFS